MTDRFVAGVEPRLPWPLCRFPWWTEPVRAERLAALRIALALVLLGDILGTYLPAAANLFGDSGVGTPRAWLEPGVWEWSPLRQVTSLAAWRSIFVCWAIAAVALLIGWHARTTALVCWLFALAVAGTNPWIRNGGDTVAVTILFFLTLSPCGAVWSLDARGREAGTVWVHPWPLRLLFIQLCIIYLVTGVGKLRSEQWRSGEALYLILSSLEWTRFSFAQLDFPRGLLQCATWATLAFELGFPVLVSLRWTRLPALALGVAFHLATGIFLILGPFPFYMLCLYVPLLAWERLAERRNRPGNP